MKQSHCKILFCTAILLGVLRFIDLCMFTQSASGLVSAGSAWLRYAVAAAFAVCLLFWPCDKHAQNADTNADNKADTSQAAATPEVKLPLRVLCAITGALAVLAGAFAMGYSVSQLIAPTTMLGMARLGSGLLLAAFAVRLIFSLGMLSFGAWMFLLYTHKGGITPQKGMLRTLGYCSLAGFAALVVMRYAEMPASVHHINVIALIFTALAALIFTNKLLGTLCVSFTPQYKCSFQKTAVFAFFMCTCIGAPQLLWQIFNGGVSFANALVALTFAVYGVLAAAAAYENAD